MTATLTPTPAAPVVDRRQPEGSSARQMWSDTLVFARRNVEHIRQIPEKLLDVTVQPLMFTVLFAYVFGGAIDVGGSYREYLIGGILVQTLVFGMMGPATSIATDLQEGVIDRFRSLPAAQWHVPVRARARRARRADARHDHPARRRLRRRLAGAHRCGRRARWPSP